MKFAILSLVILIYSPLSAMIVKDSELKIPDAAETFEIVPPYNPYSIYVPSSERLAMVSSTRVMDMGAAAYGSSFYNKAIYFYTNALAIFPDNMEVTAWANYELGYIYNLKRDYERSIEYFEKVLELRGAPVIAQNLSRMMLSRVQNRKEYRTYIKQEDIVFLAEKKAQSILNKQIEKEEEAARKRQRELSRERKRREKEEQRLMKELEKEEKRQQKLAEQEAKTTS